MPKVSRFFSSYVRSPTGKVLHILHSARSEGNLTDCGKTVKQGWGWLAGGSSNMKVCTICENQK